MTDRYNSHEYLFPPSSPTSYHGHHLSQGDFDFTIFQGYCFARSSLFAFQPLPYSFIQTHAVNRGHPKHKHPVLSRLICFWGYLLYISYNTNPALSERNKRNPWPAEVYGHDPCPSPSLRRMRRKKTKGEKKQGMKERLLANAPCMQCS